MDYKPEQNPLSKIDDRFDIFGSHYPVRMTEMPGGRAFYNLEVGAGKVSGLLIEGNMVVGEIEVNDVGPGTPKSRFVHYLGGAAGEVIRHLDTPVSIATYLSRHPDFNKGVIEAMKVVSENEKRPWLSRFFHPKLPREITGRSDLSYKAQPGKTINEVAAKAIAMAQPGFLRKAHTVDIEWGAGQVFPVNKDSTVKDVMAAFYRTTPQAMDEEFASQMQTLTSKVDDLVGKKLERAIAGGVTPLIEWIREYQTVSLNHYPSNPMDEDITAAFRTDHIIKKITAAGYRTEHEIKYPYDPDNKSNVGLHVIGQFINEISTRHEPSSVPSTAMHRYYEMPEGPGTTTKAPPKAQPSRPRA